MHIKCLLDTPTHFICYFLSLSSTPLLYSLHSVGFYVMSPIETSAQAKLTSTLRVNNLSRTSHERVMWYGDDSSFLS